MLIFLVTLNTFRTRGQIQRIESIIITVGFFMAIFYLMRYFGAPAPRGIINPDHFSAYLDMIIFLALGFFLIPTEDTRKPSPLEGGSCVKRGKDDLWPLLIFFAVIMSAALFFTMSRGGMLSFMVTLIFIAFLVSRRRSLKQKSWIFAVIAGAIALMLAWFGATPVVEKLLSIKVEITSIYFGGRLPIWRGTLAIIRDNPLFGTGLGTFNYIFEKYQPLTNIMRHYTYAHSEFLELLAETGITGFALVGISILGSIVYLFRRYRERHDAWVTGMSVCVFGSLTTIFIHSWTDFNLRIPAIAVLLAVLLALLLSILSSMDGSKKGAGDKACQLARQSQGIGDETCRDQGLGTGVHLSAGGEEPPTAAAVRYLSFYHRLLRYFVAVLLIGLVVIYAAAAARPALADYYAYVKPAGVQGLGAAIRLDPSNARHHFELGRLYGKSGMVTLQRARYLMAVKLNPTNSEYRQSLAWVLGKKKDWVAARKEYEAAIKLYPNSYYPYQAYARWLLTLPGPENTAKGMEMYKKAISLNPDIKKEAFEDCPPLRESKDPVAS